MKKIIFSLFALLLMLISRNVYALNEGINGGNKGYFYKDSLIYSSNNTCVNSGQGCLGYYYTLVYDSNASAFCLDPGLLSPNNNYRYYRELNLNNGVDQDFYKAYRYYVYNINKGENVTDIRNRTDVVIRMIINNHKFAIGTNNATRDEQFNNAGGIADYIKGKITFENINWKLGGNAGDKNANCNYWAGTSNYSQCKTIFEGYKTYYENFINYNDVWENPIKITPSVSYTKVNDENDSYYTFNFHINFKGDKNNFFDKGSYSNGYNQTAYFHFKLGNINEYYELSTGISGNVIEYTGESYITNVTNEINAFVKIKEKVYNAIKNNSFDGKVSIKLDYDYYHPLSESNVYLNSSNNTINVSTPYQRMIVFDNFVNTGTEILYDDTSLEENLPDTCIHKSDNTFIGKYGDLVSLETFKSQCYCTKINYSYLNDRQKSYYDSECNGRSSSLKVSNNLKECTVENDTEDYEIVYEKSESINSYCTKTCTETVNINDFMGKYNVKSGQYFKFDRYPILVANKSCKVDINFDSWKSNYSNALNTMVNAYNAYKAEEALQEDKDDGNNRSCCEDEVYNYSIREWVCLGKYKYSYSGTYDGYSHNDGNITISPSYNLNTSAYGTCGGGQLTFDVTAKKETFENTFALIESLQADLNVCSNELKNVTDELFYKFEQDLNYYYEQTYSDSDIGRKWNNERYSINGVDDSNFNYEKETNKSNEINGESYTFDSLLSNGEKTSSEIHSVIEREVGYIYKYTPSIYKFIDTYTSKISTNKNSLSNPTELGYVYDTDVSAIDKSNNSNYYEFTKLGDNNQIYKYFENGGTFKDNDGVEHSGSKEDMKRYCTYKTTNELLSTNESNSDNSKLNIVYRSVDPIDIDPNKRLKEENKGFNNWKNTNAKVVKAKIELDAKTNDTYNPKNLEYSFTLDSATISAIRSDNEDISYDNWNIDAFSCTNGLMCESTFISDAESGDFRDASGTKIDSFVSSINGRTMWKQIEKINSTKFKIDGEEVNLTD